MKSNRIVVVILNCLVTLAIALCATTAAFAQQNLTVKGKVIDSLSGRGMPNATVVLKPSDKKITTDANGDFYFNSLANATNYSLVISSIGYATKTIIIKDIPDNNNQIIVQTVKLSVASSELKEVVIKSAIVTQEADRIIYNIQADPRSKGSNMFDMITKVPLLSTNANDEILLNGQKHFLIFVDGKPSATVLINTAEYLRNLKAENVGSVQIITTIPARYQDQGLDGIIDIKLFKPPVSSYNGSISARFMTPNTKSVNGLLVTKSKKFGASVAFVPSWQNSPIYYTSNERYTFADKSTLMQQGANRFNSNTLRGVYEMTYDFTPQDFINASVIYNRADREFNNSQQTSKLDDSKNLVQAYDFINNRKQARTEVEASMNYQKSYRNNPEKLLTASFRYTSIFSDETTKNDTYGVLNYSNNNTQQDNQTSNKELTLQLDYVHPFKKVTMESGVKDIMRNNYTETGFTSFTNSGFNQLDYLKHRQNVIGMYNSYMLKLGAWGVRLGGRLEITNGHADFISNGTSVNENTAFFLPNLLVQKLLNKQISFNLGYTQRAERPGIWLLNPFVDRSNPQFISSGNPALRSVRYHTFNFRLSIIKKWYLYFDNKFTVADNTIESISTLQPGDVIYTSSYNVGSSRNLRSTITFSYPISKKLDWSIYAWADRIQNRAFINNQFLDRTGYSFGSNINATYTINNNLRVNLYGIVSSPMITYQRQSNIFYDTSVGVTKYFANRKFTIAVTAFNPFIHYRNGQVTTITNDFTQVNSNRELYRKFSFSFTYRFGKVNNTVKKNSRVIENSDVRSGEGSLQ